MNEEINESDFTTEVSDDQDEDILVWPNNYDIRKRNGFSSLCHFELVQDTSSKVANWTTVAESVIKTPILTCQLCSEKGELFCSHIPNASTGESIRRIFKSCGQLIVTVNDLSHEWERADHHNFLPDDLKCEFTAISTEGDGNCLFYAVSTALVGTPRLGHILRQLATLEYQQRQPIYDEQLRKYNGKTGDETFERLRTNFAFSSSGCVYVLANAIGRKINVVECLPDNEGNFLRESYRPILFDPRSKPLSVFLCRRHFSALVPNDTSVALHIAPNTNPDIYTYSGNKSHLKEKPSGSKVASLVAIKGQFSCDLTTSTVDFEGENHDKLKKKEKFPVSSPKQTQTIVSPLLKAVLETMKNQLTDLMKKATDVVNRDKEILQYLRMFTENDRERLMRVLQESFSKHSTRKELSAKYSQVWRLIKKDGVKEQVIEILQQVNCSMEVMLHFKKSCALGSKSSPDDATLAFSENETALGDEDDSEIDAAAASIRKIFGVTEKELHYHPPSLFHTTLSYEILATFFDFENKKVTKGAWGPAINNWFASICLPCAFVGYSGVVYNEKPDSGYCKLRGTCKCGMTYIIKILEPPAKGKDAKVLLISVGSFQLLQSKNCSRAISNFQRDRIAKILDSCKAHVVFLDNSHNLSGLRALHNNPLQRSTDVLRKIKSEYKCKQTGNMPPPDQIKFLQQKYLSEVHPNENLKGFIQLNSLNPNILIHLYTFGSIQLHLDQIRKRNSFTTIHLDATGGLFRNPKSKQALVYHVVGKTEDDVCYPVAEMISQSGRNSIIGSFLDTIYTELKIICPSLRQPLADMFVCDFSFALLHGISRGINHEELDDYISRSYDILSMENQTWRSSKSVIFICTAHLLNAFTKRLCKIVPKGKTGKEIVRLCKNALGRLQECCDLDEFRFVSEQVINILQKPFLSKAKKDEIVRLIETKKYCDEVLTETENDDCNPFSSLTDMEAKTLKENSKFFWEFKRIRDRIFAEQDADEDKTVNDFYCPAALDYLQNFKIPTFPLWSSAIPRFCQKMNFVRESNATIESYFKTLKHVFKFSPDMSLADYVRQMFPFFDGKLKAASLKIRDKKYQQKLLLKNTFNSDTKTESWKKKPAKKSTHISQYLSPKLPKRKLEPLRNKGKKKRNFQPDQDFTKSGDVLEKQECIPDNCEESETDLKLYVNGSIFLTAVQFLEILKDGWLSLSQMNAFIDLLRRRDTPMIELISANAIFKVGLEWDGTLLHEDRKERLQIKPNQYHYLVPICYKNHWFLIHLNNLGFTATIYDSAFYVHHIFDEIQTKVVNEIILNIQGDPTMWTLKEYEHTPKQTDGFNCGIHVLANIRALLFDPVCPFLKNCVRDERFIFSVQMLETSPLGRDIVKRAENSKGKLIEVIEDLIIVQKNLNAGK